MRVQGRCCVSKCRAGAACQSRGQVLRRKYLTPLKSGKIRTIIYHVILMKLSLIFIVIVFSCSVMQFYVEYTQSGKNVHARVERIT